MEFAMHVLEATLFANLIHAPRRTLLGDCRIEPQIDWPLDRRQFEELTEMAREAGLSPVALRKPSLLARVKRWLTIGGAAAARYVA
jgi:hypothetical protein